MRRPHLSYTYDVTMFRETFESRFTYLNGFLRNVSRFGDRPAVFDPRSTVLLTRSARTALAKTT